MPTCAPDTIISTLARRIESEYREMPGLCLTPAQAQRLFGLDAPRCGAVMSTLVESGVLARTRTGCYVRAVTVA